MGLGGKVCVVTGASSGIGRQTALDLAGAGATVCVTARRRERLEELVAELGGEPHSLFVCDVSVRKEVKALAAHVRNTYGRCDVLVNNAGFSGAGGFMSDDGLKDLQGVMATNFFGPAYGVAEFLPLLERSAPSSIINVASIAGRVAAGSSSYAASKFALVGWSECLHHELAPRGIAVSLVEPGFIPTEGWPQKMFLDSPLLRVALGSTTGVSRTIRRQIARPKVSRSTPTWYYLVRIPAVLFPPVVRAIQARYAGVRNV